MIRVGLSGGIGSGKTFIAEIFSHLGIPTYYSDERTKLLYQTNSELKSALIALFGHQVYLPSGIIDKDFLRQIIFNNTEKRESLNRLVHPFVITDFNEWCLQQTNVPYILKESALLFETGLFQQLDKTILAVAPEDLKIKRLTKRDNLSPIEIKKKMVTQMQDTEKEKFADFVIINDEKKLILPQVITIHKQLLNIR